MKKLLLTLLIIFIFHPAVFAQPKKGNVRLVNSDTHQLFVVFNPSTVDSAEFSVPENAQKIIHSFAGKSAKGIALSENKIQQLKQAHKKNKSNNNSSFKLNRIFKVDLPHASNQKLLELAQLLEELPQVEYCYLSPNTIIAPPSIDIPPTTPSYVTNQTYIQANPGVNMQYAWDLGYAGQNIRISDIEYGMTFTHEDFSDTRIKKAENMEINSFLFDDLYLPYIQHGTAVTGIVAAENNEYGITGLAHQATEYVFYPEYQEGKDAPDRPYAISRAIEESNPGDVIIFEMQAFGVERPNADPTKPSIWDTVPAEYDPIVWELTKSATDAGLIVVAAAGNTNVSLDADEYKDYMQRGDSGAIIVGGGTADVNHNRVSYSIYGSRVDLQGWSEGVFTTSEGTFNSTKGTCTPFILGNDINQAYTPCFRGTSSATPIVASCVAVLQSYYFAQTDNHLTALEIRNILKSTGTAQGTGGNIGPLPNMQAAIEKINTDYLLSVSTNELSGDFVAYPNPTTNVIYLTLPDYFTTNTTLSVYNALGQKVKAQNLNQINETIDINSFSTGVYTFSISNGKSSAIKRVVKH